MKSTRNKLPRRWWATWWFWVIAPVLLFALTIGAIVFYGTHTHWFPRPDLPAFDHSKAALLTPEKRAAYEQELFSELQVWNRGNPHYPNGQDIAKREQRWQEMANEGFELAHITLRVISPMKGYVHSLSGPMNRLEALAQQGDVGAMCLMVGLVGKATQKINTDSYESTYKKWLEQGAKQGHPECLKALGSRYLQGSDGYLQSDKEGLALLFAARKAGYAHDVGALLIHYGGKGYADPENVRRLYCWLQMDARQHISDRPERKLKDLKNEADRTGRAELHKLHDDLKHRVYTLEDCINMGTGE